MKKAENLEEIRQQAAACCGRGRTWDREGRAELAEAQFRKALSLFEGLFAETGDPSDASAVRELTETLADLCMQQGNMHGADVYYAKLLQLPEQ